MVCPPTEAILWLSHSDLGFGMKYLPKDIRGLLIKYNLNVFNNDVQLRILR